MKKKLLVLSVLSFLGLSLLGGCKKAPNDDGDIDYTDEGDIERVDGNIVYNNVELKLVTVTTGDDGSIQENIINEFNTLYDGQIHVTSEHVSRYDLEGQLEAAFNFDKVSFPDIIFNHGNRVNEYKERGWIANLDKIAEKADVLIDRDDFASSLLEPALVDNEIYGLPIDVHSAIMEVRTDILKKNNLEIPTNYQELCALEDKVNDLAKKGQFYIRGYNSENKPATEWRLASTEDPYTIFPISYGDMWVHEFVDYTAIVQNGAKIIENGMPAWNSKESATGLGVLRDWLFPSETSLNKNALSKDYKSDYDVGDAPFRAGTCLFKLQGPWSYKKDMDDFDNLLKADGGSANITTRSLSNLFAKDPSKEYASKVKGEGHCVMVSSTIESQTKRCAAAVFADYLAYNSGIEWAKKGHIPAAKSVLNSSSFKEDEAYDKYIKYWGLPTDYVVFPPTKYFSTIDTFFKTAASQSITADFLRNDISQLLELAYNDCMNYIELYA